MKIRALSIRQPWANMIAFGGKTIEVRSWKTRYRGPLLIVAAKKPRIYPAGCAMAVTRLVDCRPMTDLDESEARIQCYIGAWAWCLEDTRQIRPFRLKGQLGLFKVEIESSQLLDLRSSEDLLYLFQQKD